MSSKLITFIVDKDIHDKLLKVKKEKGISIQFQINEILRKELGLCKSRK
jgi:hypothetical protein